MKYLTDASYVTPVPISLIPGTLAYLTGIDKFRQLNWVEPLNKRAFAEGAFDGIDMNFTISGFGYFRGEENKLNTKGIKKLKSLNRGIYAFHAGHEGRLKQFKHMTTNVAEDIAVTREKIYAQLRLTKLLTKDDNPIIVFHPGTVGYNNANFRGALNVIEFLVRAAEDMDIIVALENMTLGRFGAHLGSDYKQLRYILDEIKSPSLGICFDWGHANNYAPEFIKDNKREKDYLKNFGYQREIIEELNEKIVYAHIHYNQCHLPIIKKVEMKDQHYPLTRIPNNELGLYRETIKDLVNKTSILKYDRILLELFPKRIFGIYPFWPYGCVGNELLDSLKILQEMIEE